MMLHLFKGPIKFFLLLIVITGLIYPMFVTVLSQVFFYQKANGSLIKINGQTKGSFLIAQAFHSAKYFHPRPSCSDYKTLPSGASNLALANRQLISVVQKRFKELKNEKFEELATCSGSGLDPHISAEAAHSQMARVAKNRNLRENEIKLMIEESTEQSWSEIFGQKSVNVNLLNFLLDMKAYGK